MAFSWRIRQSAERYPDQGPMDFFPYRAVNVETDEVVPDRDPRFLAIAKAWQDHMHTTDPEWVHLAIGTSQCGCPGGA